MKRYLLLLVYFFFLQDALAQGNWIDYNLDYYKIPTSRNSVCRLSYTTLSASGVNMNTLDPRNIRVFHRGEEVAVWVAGEDDGRFDPTDFIEFVGKRNDATLDKLLYQEPGMMPNPHYNTFNDTTAYFLTVTPGINGKRMREKPLGNENPGTLTNYQSEKLEILSEQYSLGATYPPGVNLSIYDIGQGWTSTVITRGNSRDFNFSDLGTIPVSFQGEMEIGLVGRSATSHISSVNVGPAPNNLREIGRSQYESHHASVVKAPLQSSDFSANGDLTVRVSSLGVDGASDNISVSYLKFTYTKNVSSGDFDREVFWIPEGESNLEISGVNGNYVSYDITDFENPVRINNIKNGSTLRIPAGASGTETKIMVQNSNTIIEMNVLQKIRFRDLLQQKADYLIISNRVLRRPAANYGDPVTGYAAYRASSEGGGFDTLTVNISELMDQFSFGEKSPLAVFEFLRRYYPRHQPEYLLLIGRSFGIYNTRRVGGINYFYRNNPGIFDFQDLLPPAGFPYSDNIYAVGLDPAFPQRQEIAVGRIPARTPEEVANYLEKVKEKDAFGVQEDWQKNIFHLSGGRSAFELERLFNFLNSFKNIAEDVYLGGRVETIRKRSNATVELMNISDEINNGTAMVTFFGHAAPSVTDIDIGFASVDELGYNNKGKYPVLLLNGCDAGNAFGPTYTFGEDWIVTPDKGASVFLAHSDIGADVYLRRYSESFYSKAFSDSSLIYQSIGKVKIEAEKLMYSRYGNSQVNQSHVNQMIMLGDPAVKIFPANRADYALNADEVFLDGLNDEPISAVLDSLILSIVVKNIGRVDLDSVDLNVARQMPDGTFLSYDTKKLAPIYRKDTIKIGIPNVGLNSAGDNVFNIEINKSRSIGELTYANNSIQVVKFIPLSGTLNLSPVDFSIVNETSVEAIAQILGKSTEERNLIVQMDTVRDFSSAARRESRITTSGLAKWKLDLSSVISTRDSMTFYWRSRYLEPKEGENKEWSNSSFSYIRNGPSEGWTQRDLSQFSLNTLDNLEIDGAKKEWKYEDTRLNIDVFTFGADTPGFNFNNTQVLLNGLAYIVDAANRSCFNGSLGLLAFDQKSLTPYLPVPLTNIDVLDPKSCGRNPQIIQNIRNAWITGQGQTMLLDYIDNMSDGDYVVIFSIGSVTFSDWPEEAYFKMRELGVNEATIRNLKTGDPYILFGRKGMRAGEAVEIAPDRNAEEPAESQILTFNTDLNGYFTNGSVLSPMIGPASEWSRFFNFIQERDFFNPELSHFDVVGITKDGEERILLSNVQENEVDLTSINSDAYPYLRLKYAVNDPDSPGPEQLDKWQINFNGVPEGVLLLKNNVENHQIHEGEEVEVKFEFSNISKYDYTDSLTVEWNFNNTGLRKSEKRSKKIPAVKAGNSHEFSIVFNSGGWAGKTSFSVFANPREFMEQTFRNNFLDLPDYFMVIKDDLNPVLDVSFDGIYIMDGDIVSPNVLISALIKDENAFVLKKDTMGIEVYLKRECESCDFERVSFSNPQLRWFEATDGSDFKIEYLPGPLEDGNYTLRVNASDAAGNMAGEKPYEINFEVINESQITNFYPYPNPFSSSVRFVFTVTGAEVPDQVKIQIMTVTGKIVREILQDELGPMRIGNNISEYAWDGKDEYGDQLANGVYIYRVLVRKDGQFMEYRATAGDKAFKKGYGKMYLLR